MKCKLIMLGCGLLVAVGMAVAQTPTVPVHITGAGGVSTGAVFTLTGSIGQWEGSPPSTGAVFEVTGGFWSGIYVLQVANTPRVAIRSQAGQPELTVAWPLVSSGFVLERAHQLTPEPVSWEEVPPTNYQSNASNRFIRAIGSPGVTFYRLTRDFAQR